MKITDFELKLIEKIIRATMRLEDMRRPHTDVCTSEDRKLSGPCSCGADAYNFKIKSVLTELEIKIPV